MKKIQISPSILSADFAQLGAEIKRLEAGAILAIETSDKETIKKMTEIVLESITYMEREKNVS